MALTALGVRGLSEPRALISFLTELRAAGLPDAERDLPVIHEALSAVLRAKLGEAFDPETSLAWWAALHFMAELAAPAPVPPRRDALLRLDVYSRTEMSRIRAQRD